MDKLLQRSLIGISIVYILNHTIAFIATFVLEFAIGEYTLESVAFGVYINLLVIYPIFAIANALIFIFVRKVVSDRWPMTLNVLLLFVAYSIFRGVYNFGDPSVLFYWIRYLVCLSPLLFINSLINASPIYLKVIIVLSTPLLGLLLFWLVSIG